MNKYASFSQRRAKLANVLSSHTTTRNGARSPKVGYGTVARARQAADEMNRKTGGMYVCYVCPTCNQYHVGRAD